MTTSGGEGLKPSNEAIEAAQWEAKRLWNTDASRTDIVNRSVAAAYRADPQLADLVAALRPFAEIAKSLDMLASKYPDRALVPVRAGFGSNIHVGDLRAAREALAAVAGPLPETPQ